MNDDRRQDIIVRCYIALFDDFLNFSIKNTFDEHFNDHITRSIRQLLRPRPEYGYATSSHSHSLIPLELDSLASLIKSSVSRIKSTRIIMFRSFASEIENEHEISVEDSTNKIFNHDIHFTTDTRLVDDSSSIQKICFS